MWFWYSLIALLCWSGSDLFSKIGCRDRDDRYADLKMVTAVGAVMGIHALIQIFTGKAVVTWSVFLSYLPVSLLYILSMAIGYAGLKYIELSISSPICNSSGAIVAILVIITRGIGSVTGLQLTAVILVSIGVIGLGIVDLTEDDELRAMRQQKSNYKYAKSLLAIAIPVIYCLLDALGTFADSIVLEKLDEDAANTSYELMFLFCGIACFIYTALIKRAKYSFKREIPKYVGALAETGGQAAYIYAIADTEHVALAAPMISAYCMLSVIWSSIFLKEKLSWKHYIMIAVVIAGIVILGASDV
ncbi:MAG: EamA family transporter [Oscillospiraceae bacterium]|jgi:uncharacterized membrane protein